MAKKKKPSKPKNEKEVSKIVEKLLEELKKSNSKISKKEKEFKDEKAKEKVKLGREELKKKEKEIKEKIRIQEEIDKKIDEKYQELNKATLPGKDLKKNKKSFNKSLSSAIKLLKNKTKTSEQIEKSLPEVISLLSRTEETLKQAEALLTNTFYELPEPEDSEELKKLLDEKEELSKQLEEDADDVEDATEEIKEGTKEEKEENKELENIYKTAWENYAIILDNVKKILGSRSKNLEGINARADKFEKKTKAKKPNINSMKKELEAMRIFAEETKNLIFQIQEPLKHSVTISRSKELDKINEEEKLVINSYIDCCQRLITMFSSKLTGESLLEKLEELQKDFIDAYLAKLATATKAQIVKMGDELKVFAGTDGKIEEEWIIIRKIEQDLTSIRLKMRKFEKK